MNEAERKGTPYRTIFKYPQGQEKIMIPDLKKKKIEYLSEDQKNSAQRENDSEQINLNLEKLNILMRRVVYGTSLAPVKVPRTGHRPVGFNKKHCLDLQVFHKS